MEECRGGGWERGGRVERSERRAVDVVLMRIGLASRLLGRRKARERSGSMLRSEPESAQRDETCCGVFLPKLLRGVLACGQTGWARRQWAVSARLQEEEEVEAGRMLEAWRALPALAL